MSKANWQLQRRGTHVRDADEDSTYEWRDIVTVNNTNKYGPGTKAQALESLHKMRSTHTHATYRIVKVSPV